MFDVLVTADRRMQYQQRLATFSIGVIVIITPRLRLQELRTIITPLRDAIQRIGPGERIDIEVTTAR